MGRQRSRDEGGWFDRIDGRSENGEKVVTTILLGRPERPIGQCSCFGSDQPERPVTALKERSNRPIS
jgi:hypothetical protein